MAMTEFDRKIRRAVVAVYRRKILDRIIAVLRHHKAVQFETRSDHIRVTSSLCLSIGGGETTFYMEAYGQLNQNMVFQVRYGGALMLEARHGLRDEVAQDVDPRLVVGNDSNTITVLTFKPGLWMKLLDLKWHIRQEERRKREEEAVRKQRERPKPVLEDDFTMAQRFGLKYER